MSGRVRSGCFDRDCVSSKRGDSLEQGGCLYRDGEGLLFLVMQTIKAALDGEVKHVDGGD